MNVRDAVRHAKSKLEESERRLVDCRTMSERLQKVIPGASDEFRGSLEDALVKLRAWEPRLEADFSAAHDCLRSLIFVNGLDPDRIHTRAVDAPRGPRRYRDKAPRSRVR